MIIAFSYIFDFLDHAALGEESLELFETMHLLMGKDKKPEDTIRNSKKQREELPKKKVKLEATPKRGFGSKAK